MRLLVLSGATAIATTFSFGLNAADLAYPPPALGQPQYGVAPPPSVSPPQVIIVPGPRPVPGPLAPPPMAGASPYGIPAPVPPQVAPGAACPPVWQCGAGGCGWQPGCRPRPERYSGPYGPPGPQVYSGPAAPPGSYPGPYAPHVYPDPNGAYPDDRSLYRP